MGKGPFFRHLAERCVCIVSQPPLKMKSLFRAARESNIKALRMEGFGNLGQGPYSCTGSNMTSVRNWMAVWICASVSSWIAASGLGVITNSTK